MKTETIFIQGLNDEVTFYIGQKQSENFDVIDMGSESDLWFHAKNVSSCHVVAELPEENLSKKELQEILQHGCRLCKENTSKLNGIHNVEFIYTQIKNKVFKKLQTLNKMLSNFRCFNFT